MLAIVVTVAIVVIIEILNAYTRSKKVNEQTHKLSSLDYDEAEIHDIATQVTMQLIMNEKQSGQVFKNEVIRLGYKKSH